MRHSLACLSLVAGLTILAAGACAATSSSVTFLSLDKETTIPARLIVPDGSGPFPAVVVVHDCSGLGRPSSGAPARWADELVPQGYAVIIPDSFTPRGFDHGVCTIGREAQERANGFVRAADAYGALAYLRTLPNIDGRHVGIMGGSHGGWTTLASMYVPIDPKNRLVAVKRDGFAAGIALYPACGIPYGAWRVARQGFGPPTGYSGAYQPIAPLLILAGELDDWTPDRAGASPPPVRRKAIRSRSRSIPAPITHSTATRRLATTPTAPTATRRPARGPRQAVTPPPGPMPRPR
jgi:dienelactone hydrolase